MMRARALASVLAVAAVLVAPAQIQSASAQVTFPSDFPATDGEKIEGSLPNRMEGRTLINEQLGRYVSGDLAFVDEQGETVRLGSLLNRGKPLAVVFVYHNCPMLCSLVLDGVADAIATTDLRLGEDYEVLAVSIDPDDTPARADSAEARYLRGLQMTGLSAAEADSALHFWTVTPETEANVEAFAAETGFGYAYDPLIGEYGHSAAAIFLSPDGKVTRYLYGAIYAARDWRLALVEAGEGTVGNTVDRFLLTCYAYDPDARGYAFYAPLALKVGGGLVLLLFGGLLVRLWLREGQRQALGTTPGDLPPDPAL